MLKKCLHTLVLFLAGTVCIPAQDFAPVGAKWTYTETFYGTNEIDYLTVESVGDTLIKGKNCRVLVAEGSCMPAGTRIVYSKPDSVFLYQPFLDSLQLLYAFDAAIGDSWTFLYGPGLSVPDTMTVTVDSTFTEIVNGVVLQGLSVTYHGKNLNSNPYQATMVERLGDMRYLFNYYLNICDMNYPGGLRCYYDNSLGVYETGAADSCTYSTVGLTERRFQELRLWPNPADEVVKIEPGGLQVEQIDVYDVTGSLMKHLNLSRTNQGQVEVDISSLNKGVYFFKVSSENQTTTHKVIKASGQ